MGQGAIWSQSSTNIDITSCVFHNNNGATDGGAVRLDRSTGNVNITNCTFQKNSATGGGGGAVMLYGPTGNVSITYCTFQNNRATYDGGAVRLSEAGAGNVSITYCTFQNNSATNGGGVQFMSGAGTGNVSITYCTFQNNSATNGGGAVRLSGAGTGNVSITYCTFQNNSATEGGGGAVSMRLLGSASDVSITYCTFQNNSASLHGGAVQFDGSTGNVSITYCTFQNNSASGGGAVTSFKSTGYVSISYCTFSKNTADYGAALYDTTSLGFLHLQEVVIKDNHGNGGGAIYFDGVKVNIFGNSQFSSNSAQGAIQGQNGLLQLHGNITFTENRGVNGGALSLSNNIPLYFYQGCRVEFSRNVATRFGGAIYNDWGEQDTKHFNLCIIRFINLAMSSRYSITLTDNHAQQGGHAVYATPIYNCGMECYYENDDIKCSYFRGDLAGHFTITSLPEDVNDTQVLSSPAHVHLCGCSDPKLCNVTSQYQGKITTYPGGTVRYNVTSVDDGNNLSPGVVYTQIDTSGITSQNITLGPRQEAHFH